MPGPSGQQRHNISAAARSLHMSRQNLQYRIKRYQIDLKKLLGEAEL
ncbi:helix-turn-helix domain-containing protein [Dysosmobacter welbionis]|nr:helix-turn-helix domain-containing protein [Dysosmobacter welbionis]